MISSAVSYVGELRSKTMLMQHTIFRAASKARNLCQSHQNARIKTCDWEKCLDVYLCHFMSILKMKPEHCLVNCYSAKMFMINFGAGVHVTLFRTASF